MIRKIPVFTFLTFYIVPMFHFSPLFAQSPIPEGAIEWFGKGRIYDMKYSPYLFLRRESSRGPEINAIEIILVYQPSLWCLTTRMLRFCRGAVFNIEMRCL